MSSDQVRPTKPEWRVYCHTCKTNLVTYVLGRGVQKYTRKQAFQAAEDHVKRAPDHDVAVSAKVTEDN